MWKSSSGMSINRESSLRLRAKGGTVPHSVLCWLYSCEHQIHIHTSQLLPFSYFNNTIYLPACIMHNSQLSTVFTCLTARYAICLPACSCALAQFVCHLPTFYTVSFLPACLILYMLGSLFLFLLCIFTICLPVCGGMLQICMPAQWAGSAHMGFNICCSLSALSAFWAVCMWSS